MSSDPGSAVLVPVAILVLLSLVAWGKGRPSLSGFTTVLVSISLAFAAVRSFLPDEFFWLNSPVEQRARWAARHLKKKTDWEKHPVFILLGSSATNFSIDHELLERLLAERGTPATVLSFAMLGQTHLERRYAVEAFLRQIGEEGRRKLASARVALLHEIFDAYDRYPLYRFEKEAFTERYIQFLNPANAWRGWKTYRAQLVSEPQTSAWPVAALLAHHALLNQFAVGSFSDMKWPGERKRIDRTFQSLPAPEAGFDYTRTVEAWKNAPPRGERIADASLPYEQWSMAIDEINTVMLPYADEVGFFALPVLEPARAHYAEDFALALDDPQSPVWFLPTDEDMQGLMSEELWFDGVHPTAPGAVKITELFARRLQDFLPAAN